MIVSAASRMFSAISFGVFCRLAPSTRAIIRSMKLSPGFWVIRTTIRSDSTFVPPVTARPVAAGLADDRGGLAGDRRLVDAGDALDDVAVAGDDLAGLDHHEVALPQLGGAATDSSSSVRGRTRRSSRSAGGRWCPAWPRRSVAAWALPRPSATASARLAKTTVSHSQTVMAQAKTLGSRDGQDGGEHRADLDDEHDRVAPQRGRVELAQRVRRGLPAAASGRAGRRRPGAVPPAPATADWW